MTRRPRCDAPGSWHHVVNRGLARRTVFEDRAGVRYFLAQLARVARKGDLEIHAFVCMATHFHLLVRSPREQLSESMRRVQNSFVRWFNRRHRRDGPLFRGRFLSKPVDGAEYRAMVVRYLDHNPVRAGMVRRPEEYPHGSAALYHRVPGPRWLHRSWIEDCVRESLGRDRFTKYGYQRLFGAELEPRELNLVRARLRHPSQKPSNLDDLIRAAPPRVLKWMREKAELADGVRPALPCAAPEFVQELCSRAAEGEPDWFLRRGRNAVGGWSVLLVALLRDVAGQSWTEIAHRCEIATASAHRRYRCHRAWLGRDEAYDLAVTKMARQCVNGSNTESGQF